MQVKLDDGYNGGKALFDDNPIAVDGDLVQLRCVEPGKEYMTAWKHKDDVAQAKAAVEASGNSFDEYQHVSKMWQAAFAKTGRYPL